MEFFPDGANFQSFSFSSCCTRSSATLTGKKMSSLLSLQHQNTYFYRRRRVYKVGILGCENGRSCKLARKLTGSFHNNRTFLSSLTVSIHIIDNKRQAFYTIMYLNQFAFAVVVTLPSYISRSLVSHSG